MLQTFDSPIQVVFAIANADCPLKRKGGIWETNFWKGV